MKIVGDTHTHTIACQHAYSTIMENVAQAKALGHRFLALTDHAPTIPATVHDWYFDCITRFVPPIVDDVVVLRGCEVNILEDAKLDLRDSILRKLDWVIASMHGGIMPTDLSSEEYTRIWLKIAENPYVDCIGHMGQVKYPCDYDRVIQAFVRHNKVIEINSASPSARPGCEENCREVVRLCKKYGAKLVLSSDAHFALGIGKVDWSIQLVTQAGYPEEDILNLSYSRMAHWLREKKGLTDLPEE